MKKIFLVGSICLAIAFSHQSYAQLSKSEKKEWKKKAKEYKRNPAALKQVVDDNQVLNQEVGSLRTENEELKSTVAEKDAIIEQLRAQMEKLRSDLSSAKSRASSLQAELNAKPKAPEGSGDMSEGVAFKVQIGAFRNKDLSKYFENNENFGGENTEDGTQKITLGQFRDYWEADTFKKYLREMGVKDAWIVPYKDGIRVEIKDVLEGVITEESPSEDK